MGKDTYHHTFFEMLGNWSFDDYFKAEAIRWAWELFTEVWGIDPDRLWASVFAGDEADGLPEDSEAAALWPKVTSLPAEKVLAFGKKDNFWEMGEVGPCGPCSEIHIDLGPEMCDMKGVAGHVCGVNAGCARYIELWNLVFIEFNRQGDGELVPLGAKYVDTGAGLERIVAVMQAKPSDYDTDLFMPIIDSIGGITGHKYTSQLGNKTDNAFRVIADHIRSLTFAITDGAAPANEGRGYVIRRILRRASRFGRELGMHEPFLYKLVPVVVDCLGDAFDEIRQRADYVSTVIESEEAGFGRTLDRGIEIFASAAERAAKADDKTINGEDAFQLYDTYGFPLDLTELMAAERGLKVDTAKFDELMEAQRQRARAAQKSSSFAAALTDTELPETEDMHKYHTDSCEAKVLGWIDDEGFKKQGRIDSGAEVGLVLERTCFYAEAGGQVGDCGLIKSDKGQFVVESTAKRANCVIHRGRVTEGTFGIEEACRQLLRRIHDKGWYDFPQDGQSVEGIARGPKLGTFTDAYVDGIVQKAAGNQEDEVIAALATSIRHRKPPKLLREVDVYTKRDTKYHAGAAFRQDCALKLADLAKEVGIPMGLFLLCETPPLTLEERPARVSADEARELPAETEEELIKVFVEGEEEPVSIVDLPESVLHEQADYFFQSVRLYVVLNETNREQRAKDLRERVRDWGRA